MLSAHGRRKGHDTLAATHMGVLSHTPTNALEQAAAALSQTSGHTAHLPHMLPCQLMQSISHS